MWLCHLRLLGRLLVLVRLLFRVWLRGLVRLRLLFRMRLLRPLLPMRLRRPLRPLGLRCLVLRLGLGLRRLWRLLMSPGLLGIPRIGVLVAHRASPSCTANSTARSRASPKLTGSVPEVPA